MDQLPDETILAQEQAVVNKGVGFVPDVEASLDVSKSITEGTLILTNKRLVYARGDSRESIPIVGGLSPASKPIAFLDADDLDDIRPDPANLSINLALITSVVGHKRMGQDPRLDIKWNDGSEKKTEFVQQITGKSRKKNLTDWPPVIQRLREGAQKFTPLPPAPDLDTLEGKVYHLLSDYEERGPLTVENEIERRYSIDLEPEDVEVACEKLVGVGLVAKTSVAGEAPYYQKVSPLGADTLDA